MTRHYDLDNLRSLAIFLLILFHTGMAFVPWGWHITNPETSLSLTRWMTPLHHVRMPVLFVIAGAVTALSLQHCRLRDYARGRLYRLGWPVVFAVFVIVPPQLWVERTVQGAFYPSLWAFYRSIFEFQPYPEGNLSWHHLWFVAYLLVYSLLTVTLLRFGWVAGLTGLISGIRSSGFSVLVTLLLALPLIVIELWLRPHFPETHALIGDWATLAFYGILFGYGYCLFASLALRRGLARNRRTYVILALLLLCLPLVLPQHRLASAIDTAIWPLFTWTAVLASFGYAHQYLNRQFRYTRYCQARSYCVYVLHQTVIVMLVWAMLPLNIDWVWKFLMISSLTLGISLLGFEFLRFIPWVRGGVGIFREHRV